MFNPLSGIKLKDFFPPVIEKIAQKVENRLNTTLFKGKRGAFRYVPTSVNPSWILDIGAADGATARDALDSYSSTRVVSVEPTKSTFEKLTRNLARYGDRVIYINKAISDYCGEGEINVTSSMYANSLCEQTDLYNEVNPQIKQICREKIEVVTLDNSDPIIQDTFFDIVKIDVEGLEMKVLNGGEHFFRNNVDIVLLEMSLARDESWEKQSYLEICNRMNELGFRLINVYDVQNSTSRTNQNNLMMSQMDGVFRHISKIE